MPIGGIRPIAANASRRLVRRRMSQSSAARPCGSPNIDRGAALVKELSAGRKYGPDRPSSTIAALRFCLCRSKTADAQALTVPDNPVAPTEDTRRRILRTAPAHGLSGTGAPVPERLSVTSGRLTGCSRCADDRLQHPDHPGPIRSPCAASATASADSCQGVVRDSRARLRRGNRRSGIGDVNSGLRHDDRPPNTVPPVMRVVHPWMR